MTQEISSNQSKTEQGEEDASSVFDFLYYDVTRIASFLSQFDASGHMTSFTSSGKRIRKRQVSSKDQVTGNLGVFKGAKQGEEAKETSTERLSSSTYDPRWVNALEFLEYLEERQLLAPNIETARIGQIILFTGSLAVFDMGMLKQMWDMPSVKTLALNSVMEQQVVAPDFGNRRERRKNGVNRLQSAKKVPSELEAGMELMGVMPHAIQAAVSTENVSAWMSLKEEHTATSPADLFMKHGLTIAGDWSLVGVVDALPDEPDFLPPDGGPSLKMLQQMVAGSKLGQMSFHMASALTGPARQLFGRPPTSYGITPLLIFREVSGS